MRNKFILSLVLGVLVLSVLSTGFVSAGFLDKFTITGHAVSIGSDGWSDWLDRDGPGGSGDWELRNSLGLGSDCQNPTAIECQTVDGKTISETGQDVTCDLNTGLVCLNKNNGGSSIFGTSCEDYRVRFKCGASTSEGGKIEFEVVRIYNSTTTDYSKDAVQMKRFDGELYKAEFTSEGIGYFNINGKTYQISFSGNLGVLSVPGAKTLSVGDRVILDTSTGLFSKVESVSTCGNEIQEVGEQCDGNVWAPSANCANVVGDGYTGTLSCSSNCKFDTSGCVLGGSATEVTYQGVFERMGQYCSVWSVSSPNSSREVSGNEICSEREAGYCTFSMHYEVLNEAIESLGEGGYSYSPGSGVGIIQSCRTYGKSTDTVAYCCY